MRNGWMTTGFGIARSTTLGSTTFWSTLRTAPAIQCWALDSRKIATFQQDQRKDGEMYLVPVTNSHPQLKAWKYPLVGDKDVTMIERVIIDVPARKVIRLKMPPDQHRSTLCD